MEIFMLVIGIIIGCFTGFIFQLVYTKKHKIYGTLEIDMTNEVPYTRLLASCQIEELAKCKIVSFDVRPDATFTRQKQIL